MAVSAAARLRPAQPRRDLTDEEIYAFCDAHPADPRCLCLHPDSSVVRIGRDTLLPYYCWYEPCKRADAMLPAALKKNISRCNVSDCTVSLGDVALVNGRLNVHNACGSLEARVARFQTSYLNQEIVLPLLRPAWLPVALAAVAALVVVACR
ncbi:IMV membrane protein [Squirrelpox virus]|uniref:IMV membrane protein n=1 Tax=Squirrelpox virus TaxID=240426 RepID=U3UBJ6_9POXV|nr:IMV membrane protein [Squirrelpox virus]CCD83245.1 IMV membrane protein [Squirrelpox virus]